MTMASPAGNPRKPSPAGPPPTDGAVAGRRSAWMRLRAVRARILASFRRLRGDMATPRGRVLGTVEHLFVDHAIFRFIYLNRHEISPGVERSAQPSPRHIRAAAARGVRTMLNIRGPRPCVSYVLEQRACEAHGIRLVDFVLTSRAAPPRERLLALDALFAELELPLMMHCKSGADRVGLASALYMLLRLDRPVEEALRQLDLRFGHFRHSKTGVLDAVLLAYKEANDREPVDFRCWVREQYDPAAVTASFRAGRFESFLNDIFLRRE